MRIMKSNSITSLSKHADFLLLDEIALVVAFSFAYFFKFGNFGFIESPSWRGLLLCLALGDLLFTILTNPYSGIFRRRYWEDVRIQLVLALESFLTACTLFYLLKMGEDFSARDDCRHLLSLHKPRPPPEICAQATAPLALEQPSAG